MTAFLQKDTFLPFRVSIDLVFLRETRTTYLTNIISLFLFPFPRSSSRLHLSIFPCLSAVYCSYVLFFFFSFGSLSVFLLDELNLWPLPRTYLLQLLLIPRP